jgi:hypothetical protein
MADLSFQMTLCRSPGHGGDAGSQEITVTSRFRVTNNEHHRRTSVKPPRRISHELRQRRRVS